MSKEREFNRIMESILKIKSDEQIVSTRKWIALYHEHYKDDKGALELRQMLDFSTNNLHNKN